jgi:hypothetical protein
MLLSHSVAKECAGKGEFMSYSRFAIYYMPSQGPLADFGADWLGWDIARGCKVTQLDLPNLHDITMTPRKYGFHGTLKPPFRLQTGTTLDGLQTAVANLAGTLVPARCDGLALTTLSRFIALTPTGDISALRRVAGACVSALDDFRAPATKTELTRRRQTGLSVQQDALLLRWGYPYVMDEFRFHLTLSGRLSASKLAVWAEKASQTIPDLPTPFVLDQIALCGERPDGYFELIHRYTLAG